MPQICLVVPCFNEARRLDVAAFAAHLRADHDCTCCFVNDGSTDATADVLARLRNEVPQQVEIVTLDRNAGKAEAVRRGMLHAAALSRFELIGYWDADLATPLSEVDALRDALHDHPACVMTLASRLKRLGSSVERSGARHVGGRIFATLASMTLDLPVYDSQCGAKLFRATAVPQLFDEAFITRWLFDVELLARLKQLQPGVPGAAIEVPLTIWRDVSGSKLGLGTMILSPIDLWRIRSHYFK